MIKYVFYCFLITLIACNTTIEIETEDNYESVILPDGSLVYLNHDSSISYDENFQPRTLNLNGEAFFTVISDESIFTVSTTHGDIEVLGTEFNVKTMSEQIIIDVEKGLVELKTAYNKSEIEKGIMATYKEGERAVKKIKSDRRYTKWVRSLKKEFNSLGKQLKPVVKDIGNEFEKTGKRIGDEFKD